MQIFPVLDKTASELFLNVPSLIYANDPLWIQPLRKDLEEVFDVKKNKAFRFGKIQRWVLLNNHKRPIGRIAAFVNKKYKNKGDEFPVGGIGFFECIDNQDAADLLFDNAKHWLLQEKMQAMDGPINFGERDRWWGLVTEGFSSPLYCMNYNPPYYKTLIESYGFLPFYEQWCFGMNPHKNFPEKIIERHRIISNDPNYIVRNIEKKNLKKYAADFTEIYNKAWAGHGGMKQLSNEQVLLMFKKMKPVIDEKIIWFAYHHDIPIGMFINIPDLNQWFKHLHGKFGIFQKFYFLWLTVFQKNTKFTGMVFGIIPEYQAKGIDAFIVGEAAKTMATKAKHYTTFEMQWIGDFNPKMINMAKSLGDVFITRKLTTYRYNFDRNIPFQRHPII